MKLWQKKYTLDKEAEKFTVGNDFVLDKKLIKYDCQASIAHAKMLAKCKLLETSEADKIVKELENIIQLDKQDSFEIKQSDEDCHTAIENYLVDKLGDLGKKIHTARSRNDQVLTALRLYYKDQLLECQKYIDVLIKTVEIFVKKYGQIEIPGFTHTRKAMPSSIELWAGYMLEAMEDNKKQLVFNIELIDQSPLGTAAGYNVPLDIDRDYVAKLLGFAKVQKNPIYVQNSRLKFEADILHSLSQIMFDLNKIASDLIMFSMPEFGFYQLPDTLCTGSSIMPQKKNPDVLELIRAKYHVVNSYQFQIKNMMPNLISGYHRDYQLSKGPVFEAFSISKQSLSMMSYIFDGLKINKDACKEAMTKELYATEEAYKLVKKGMPFREAYQKIAKKYDV